MSFQSILTSIHALMPGVLIAGVIALASQFVAEHYGAPAMLLALLFGVALNFLSSDGRAQPGIAFGATTLLRLGVALLGVRITAEVLLVLGAPVVALVVAGLGATIALGLIAARVFGFTPQFGFLSAGAVAICGASAAMAIAAILPKDDKSEERLIFTVVGVTLLSTVAMILYPVLGAALGLDDRTLGIFIGATVHDVAQVVGAGFSVSEEAGKIATLVKLLRVTMLAPVVLIAVLILRRAARDAGGRRPPLIPGFVLGFLGLAALGAFGVFPPPVVDAVAAVSGWLLLVAIASVGLKTRPEEIAKVGLPAAGFLIAQTMFLAFFALTGLWLMGAV